MPSIEHVVSQSIPNTFRVARVQGIFDIPRTDEQRREWSVDVPDMSEDWTIGAIVGPSGSGKSQIASAAFTDDLYVSRKWEDVPLIDAFPTSMSLDDIVSALTSSGLSSTPSWLLPYHALSTGQKFRADLAYGMLTRDFLVYDEFTSVVDRNVAKSSSIAIAKWIRRANTKRFVAVTCHYDVLEWLEPDWVIDMSSQTTERGRLRRPEIDVVLIDGGREQWPRFREHHYMSGSLHRSCRTFTAWVGMNGNYQIAGFFSLLPIAGHKGWWRGHRTVVLPDFQGMGVGNIMIETAVEKMYSEEGKRFRATTSARPLIEHRKKHPDMWKLVTGTGMRAPAGKTSSLKGLTTSAGRLTTTWEYIPRALRSSDGHTS